MPEPAPTPASADRNLLFGILALQMDFISRDALIRAMHAWVLDKHMPLGQILLEQGALRAGTRAALDLVVQEHLEQHGNDPQRSLAAVSSIGSVRQELQQVADPDIHASLAHVSAARPGEADPCLTSDYSAGTPTSAGLRFRVVRPHARGGLGEVFVAHDKELHREVALKEIQSAYADDAHRRARFLLEAEVTGGLEHPGVVPVYGLGTYPDGRPFYAMRFIRGESLKEAIKQFHAADVPGRDPGERTLALRQLLGRFVAVCNAVAYAHSRGVIHRDLKPGNVMLGPFGETLLVDWGLSKVVGRPAAEEGATEETLRPPSAEGSAPTQVGSAVGTPPYMSPEQAAGKVDQLGPASDIYSLGATFYCLLTGKAPFEGRDVGEVLRQVQQGKFAPPRQVKQGVPAALEAVCLKAMALRAEDRYPTARALAGDVEKWLADEPVGAWREPLRLRAGRWARRHLTAVAACAAGLLVAVLAGGAGAWWLDKQRSEQRQAVETALAEVGRLQEQAHWSEAHAVLDQAQQRLGSRGPHDLAARLERAAGELALVKRLEDIRLKRAAWVGDRYATAGADRDYEEVFGAAGLGEVGGDAATAAAWVRDASVRAALVAALDDWAFCARERHRRAWLLEVVRQADPDPWRNGVRDPAAWADADLLAQRARGEQAAQQSPQLLVVLGVGLRSKEAEELLKGARERHPGDFWVNFQLGNTLMQGKKPVEAVGYYLAALALRPGTVPVHNNLGVALYNQHKVEEAIAEYRKAIALDPKYANPHYNLGIALSAQGKIPEAIAEYRNAIALDPNEAKAHHNLGVALYEQHKVEEAIAAYRKAIALDPNEANAHNNLGNALYEQHKVEEAIAEYRKATELDPKFALPHCNLGHALYDQHKVEEAIAEYRKAIALDPKYLPAHYNLGIALSAQGKIPEAIAEYRKAIALDPESADAHHNLGLALYAQGQVPEAIAEYRKAIELNPKSAALAHINLGITLSRQGKVPEAIAEIHKAIELDPKLASAHHNLAFVLEAQGKVPEAIAEYRKAIELDPKLAHAHGGLGQALLQQGQFPEALRSTQRCLDLLPPGHPMRPGASRQLHRCEQMVALDQKLAAVLKGDSRPANAAEQVGLAGLCVFKKRYADAARFYADAFANKPVVADDLQGSHRYNAACAAALAAAGQGADTARLDDMDRAHLRQQALGWLRADVALWGKQAEGGTPQTRALVQQTLRHWQEDADLAGLRDAAALAKLPEAERAEWQKLWADAEETLKKVAAPGME
jgi:serine/threonine-protein kinase